MRLSMEENSSMKEKKVVVAVDESEESMHALWWCLTNLLSGHPNSTLILIYIKPPPPIYSSSLDHVTGFLFAGDVVASMEKHSNDLASSMMKRAEAVYKNLQDFPKEILPS